MKRLAWTGRTRLSIAVVCVATIAVGVVAWLRLNRVTEASNPELFWVLRGRERFAAFDAVSVHEADSIESVIALATLEDADARLGGDRALEADLRTLAAEFLSVRFNAQTPEEYVAWMESRGYAFKALDEFAEDYGPLSSLTEAAGLTSNSTREAFDELWSHPKSRAASIHELCMGESAALITIGRGTPHRWTSRQPDGVLGSDLWIGRGVAKCRFWMRPPVTRDSLLQRRGEVSVAIVSVIVQSRGGQRCPLHLYLFLDPANRWWIDGFSIANCLGSTDEWICMEF